MTLVLSVYSRDSLWLVVDRRLSYEGRPPVDDAVKVLSLEATDGTGLLAYAGLGATPLGTQPSEWMSAVLRGRGGLTFEQALGVLAAAANRELPRHLATIPSGVNTIIVPAFIHGIGPRLYSIDNIVNRDTGRRWYRFTKHQATAELAPRPQRIAVAGTGGMYLAARRDAWWRTLLSLVKAHDSRKVSDRAIADFLAGLNHEAHRNVRNGTVGPRCIVLWRRRPGARRPTSGGGHEFYTGIDPELRSDAIPKIMNGMDVTAIGNLLVERVAGWLENPFADGPALDRDEMNRRLSELPGPDHRLR